MVLRKYILGLRIKSIYTIDLERIVFIEFEGFNDIDEININGFYFSQLEECIQEAIKEATLSVVIINNPTEDEMSEYFYYLNNGMALTSTVKARANAKSKKELRELGDHEIHKSVYSEKMIKVFENEKFVVRSYVMLYDEELRMSPRSIDKLMEAVVITNDQKKEIMKIYDRMMNMRRLIEDKKVAKKVVTRTHTLSIVPIVKKSIDDNLSDKQMADWFAHFFSGKNATPISESYKRCATLSTTSKESIRTRVSELEKSYNTFFEKDLAMAS